MLLPFIVVVLGILSQALLFLGWPILWHKIHFSSFREGVFAFINEQSLWLMTLIFWYMVMKHSLFGSELWVNLLTIIVSILMTILVMLATFTSISLPKSIDRIFYVWYLGLDLYISLVFLIRSPSNIFVDRGAKTIIDYYFFGMILMHLLALLDFLINYQYTDDLGRRYTDRQVPFMFPVVTTGVAFVVLLIAPSVLPIPDFAFVGGLLAIGTFLTGQRVGYQNVGTKPKIK